ncbi:uncharacterized protein LOC126882731 [Diabrotica virgifera virgifera]|uniref:SAP domain-containing protein n=1 Tax=Diabrotica virgifera virgifera TaxID=50390 RepID=A0ABM5K0F8_DIAVI|nr:uncharacterized protein LOC126882731 [Diabrotica virgifera virgifera]
MPSLCKLTIADLRLELEERDLSSTGKKADLVERLKNALKKEGHDPETYVFEDKHAALISSITSLESKVSSEISQVSSDVLNVLGTRQKSMQMCAGIAATEDDVSPVIHMRAKVLSAMYLAEVWTPKVSGMSRIATLEI